ncbi:MAG: ubiquinone biosynthesis regulatory protein kinase UbiB [Pseudomonadales bacterium]|jgi:ubiquinone biosynthesis protein
MSNARSSHRAGRLSRSLKIIRTVIRYRLDTLVEPYAPARMRWLFRLSPLRLVPVGGRSRGERLKLALYDLGPVFIKFGQLLSTRRDLIPLDIADELAELQDAVPPFPGGEARAIVSEAIGEDFGSVFAAFADEPMASASVAQVHPATLAGGDEVVVKVVRPQIERVIDADMGLLESVAGWLDDNVEIITRLHLPDIVADYQGTITDELDMRKEAANTEQLRENFAGSELLYVPRVYHPLCRTNVLVLERIHGVPIANVAELKRRGTDMKKLAERGVETFFTQVFEHNFFHADMHPGNIFVNVDDPQEPSYIAIDCAIIGRLEREDQDYLARNLLAFFNRDYAQVARLHLESGWIPQDTDPEAFERVIRDVCEPIFAKPLNEISFGHFLVQLFQAARDFNMEVQPQLVLLQKTLLYIEGLGRELYPELDLWATAKPFMEEWMVEHVGPGAALREVAAHAGEILERLPELPGALLSANVRLKALERHVRTQSRELKRLEERLARSERGRLTRRLSGSSLLVVAGLLLFNPLSETLAAGAGLSVSAGVASALLGSLLLLKA